MRNIYKSSLFLALLLLSFPSHAQYFDWVKTYSGLESQNAPTNKIVRMDHDSRGNIYILGEFGVGATINGTSLLPMAPYGPNNKTVNTLIAKMSPSGELLWSKALHSNNGQHNHCRDMHIIGDTSLVCVVDVCLPASGTNYLYYLDTLLLQDDNNYLVPMDSIDGTDMTAFISFDLNGNVQEQHFICAAFIDSVGNLMTSSYVLGIQSNRAQTKGGQCFSFDIDNEGNIIIARYTQDMWHVRTAPNTYVEHSVWNGKIAGVRFYIDGIRHLTYFPQNRPNQWNINILKFSPHFENLLYSQYLIQPDSSHVLNSTSQHNDIKLMHDDSNNVYAVGYLMTSSSDFLINGLPLDTLPTAGISYFGFLVRYDTSLSPEYVQYVKNNNNDYRYWASTFNNATIQDSNIYISASNDKSPMYHDSEESQLSMGDTNLDLIHNACFFRLNKENGELISYGKAESGSHTRNLYSDIIVSNNRVFELVSYLSDLRLPDTTFNAQGTNYENGLMIWSCDGHPLEYIDFQASHPDNEIGTLTLHDSAIYIGGMLYGAAQFDTIPISCQRSTAFVAKYIDSTFVIPYVYTDTRLEQSIVWNQSLTVNSQDSVIILTASATSNLPISYICSDTSIARIISDTLYVLREGTAEVTAYQNGNDTFLPATPVVKRLEISAVGISPVNRINTIIYPSPTSNIVHIKNNEHITSLFVTDLYGRRERLMIKNNTINIEHLSKGIYFFEILSEHGKTIIKIIKD